MKTEYTNKKRRGFSLVEMLVVISVIGIIAAVAIPQIGNISGKADTAAAKRNAQTACMLYTAARGSGATFDSDNKSDIIDELVDGKTSADVLNSEFKMSPMEEGEKTQAMAYIQFDAAADVMTYHEDGNITEDEPEDEGVWEDAWARPQAEIAADVAYYQGDSSYDGWEFRMVLVDADSDTWVLQYKAPADEEG